MMFTLNARARLTAALTLAATLLASALGPMPSVGSAAEPADPAARIQVVTKQVYIHDDREGIFSGGGEMELYVDIWRCEEGIPPPCLDQAPALPGDAGVRTGFFDASTGDTVTLERVVPGGPAGFAVHAGRHHVVRFNMFEEDGSFKGEDMGDVFHVLDTGEHGLGIGTHTARSFDEERYSLGDFTITYEIRPAPLPDLKALHQITVDDLPGSAEKRVCMVAQNDALVPAGPFEVALRVDGVVPPDGKHPVASLGPRMNYTACVETALPTSGQHLLAAVVDGPRAVVEFDETNNVYEQTYTATESSAPPSQALPDLTVSAVRVRGQVPDGKDDCKKGRNDVSVLVKNTGAVKAGDFRVRLVVDDDSGTAREEELADGLDAGKEHEVRFDDVRLTKGERTLLVIADAKGAIAESKEDNNELKVTARCQDDD
jgi:hypothetical protein